MHVCLCVCVYGRFSDLLWLSVCCVCACVEKAVKNSMTHHEHDLELCGQLKTADGKSDYPAGHHVLTLVPKEKTHLIFAWLLHT